MRRGVLRPAIATVAVCIAYWATDRMVAMALSRCVEHSQLRFSRVYSGRITGKDIIALGNSRGVNGFYAPEVENVTGLGAYNLSYNGMSINLAELVLGDYLERYPPPRVLVLEITCLFSNDGFLKSLRTYQDHSPRIAGAVRDRYPRLYWAGRIAHCFRYNNELFLRALYYLRRVDQDWINRRVIDRAFAETYQPRFEADPFDLSGGDHERNLASLDRIVALCKHRGVELRLLVSPYLPGYIAGRGSFKSFTTAIQARTGLRVWDYSDRISDLSMFADPLHINARGCRAYTALLAAEDFFLVGKALDGAPSR